MARKASTDDVMDAALNLAIAYEKYGKELEDELVALTETVMRHTRLSKLMEKALTEEEY